ncbi:MAG: VWA domain-containing protein [Acidobacteriota bacterium]|nr:VWA domain-containing protein [Acidobacteriota bacterium]
MNHFFTLIWRHGSRVLVILLCQVGLCWTGYAQQPVDPTPAPATAQRPRKVFPAEPETPDDVLRIDTDVVSVDVSVTDNEGRPVRNLTKQDFKVFADGQEQALSFFQVERRAGPARPLAIVFAVDISGSMTTDEILRLRTALRAFSANVADQQAVYAVMAFGMNVKTLQRFTSEASKLDRALERVAREPNGLSTHTYDAVDDAIRLLVRQAPRTRDRRLLKRAVIVVTDGFPVGDTVSAETVIERANEADVSVYTVTLPSYSRVVASTAQTPLPTPLDVSELAERTGGRNLYADQKDYQQLFRALAEEVTSTYVLAFYPTEEKRRDGKFHEIKVQGPNGLTVRQSRPGYQAQEGNSRPPQ